MYLTTRRCEIKLCIFTVLLFFSQTAFKSAYGSESGSKKLSSEELLRRRKIVNAYLSENGLAENDWIETYHLKLKAHNSKTNNEAEHKIPTDSVSVFDKVKEDVSWVSDKPLEMSHTAKCKRERLYLVRWVTKLLHKYESNRHGSMCFSFSPELIINFKGISEDFDIIRTDELICGLISNATFYDGNYRISFFPSIDNLLYYFGIIGCFILFFYFLYYFMKNHPYITLMVLISAIFIFFHARKHYKTIMAQKHATMSSVLPENCISTLTSESGIFDSIKDYIRRSFYHEDCKKYYEAVMIDPSEEISIPIVAADLVASIFLQFFKPLASTLNYFVKEILYDLSFFQMLSLIPLFITIFCFALLIFRYKIHLPFFMGSFEPTVVHTGSRAEDLNLEHPSGSPVVNVNIFPRENNSSLCIHKNDMCSARECVKNNIEQLTSDIDRKEISKLIREKGIISINKETVNICDEHNSNENLSASGQFQINSDEVSASDGDKSGREKLTTCNKLLKENCNSPSQICRIADDGSNCDSAGDISDIHLFERCNEQNQTSDEKDLKKQN